MPTFTVTLAHRQTRQLSTIEVEAPSKDHLGDKVDLSTYQIAGFEPVTKHTTPHTAAATHAVKAGTQDAAIINLLASIDQRLDRMHRRRIGIVSIAAGSALGTAIVTAVIVVLIMARMITAMP